MSAPEQQGVVVDHVQFPAGRIRYYRAGTSGPAIVLLHGGGIDNATLSWRHAISTLAVDHRVYVPDLPRHGGSRQWQGQASQRNLEEIVRWLLDSWQVQDTTLVGLSMGGSVAAGFALRHPQRVRGLALVAASGMQQRMDKQFLNYLMVRTPLAGQAIARVTGMHRRLAEQYLTRGVFAGEETVSDSEQLLEEVMTELRGSRSVFVDWQKSAIGPRAMHVNHLPHLGQLRCPTMFIHGEQDRVVPVSASREAAGLVRGSHLRVISGAGHWCHREKPNEFNALLREFVNH